MHIVLININFYSECALILNKLIFCKLIPMISPLGLLEEGGKHAYLDSSTFKALDNSNLKKKESLIRVVGIYKGAILLKYCKKLRRGNVTANRHQELPL